MQARCLSQRGHDEADRDLRANLRFEEKRCFQSFGPKVVIRANTKHDLDVVAAGQAASLSANEAGLFQARRISLTI